MNEGRQYSAIAAALLVAALSASPVLARDWYVSGAATLSRLNDPDSVIQNAPTPGATLYITNRLADNGWGGQLALGHRFGAVRFEAEAGRTHTDARRYVVTNPINNDLPQTGADAVTRVMANAYVDIPLHGTGIRPYLGGGLGRASVHVTTKASKPFGPPTAPVQLIDDHINNFALQAIAGVAIPLSANVALTAQYRYFDAATLHGHDTRGQDFQTDIRGHNLDLGLRLSF